MEIKWKLEIRSALGLDVSYKKKGRIRNRFKDFGLCNRKGINWKEEDFRGTSFKDVVPLSSVCQNFWREVNSLSNHYFTEYKEKKIPLDMEKQPTIWNQDFNLKIEIFTIQS